MKQKRERKSRSGPHQASADMKAKPVKLRIIGGDMRGRTIHYHGELFTRPMKDNIRENLFNILNRAVRGAICFDLFAGTGALGFESLSRGASSVVMVEQNRQAIRYIQKTLDSLDVGPRARVITGDTFRLAGQLLSPPTSDTPWVVFVCPPYALWHDSLEQLNRIIQTTLDHAPPGSVLMAETERSFDHKLLPAGNWDLREYGGTRLAFIEPAMCCGLDL